MWRRYRGQFAQKIVTIKPFHVSDVLANIWSGEKIDMLYLRIPHIAFVPRCIRIIAGYNRRFAFRGTAGARC